jgi:hypothetical protein
MTIGGATHVVHGAWHKSHSSGEVSRVVCPEQSVYAAHSSVHAEPGDALRVASCRFTLEVSVESLSQ